MFAIRISTSNKRVDWSFLGHQNHLSPPSKEKKLLLLMNEPLTERKPIQKRFIERQHRTIE